MPCRDGTGPMGQGPATGRGLGPCGRRLSLERGGRGFGWRASARSADFSRAERIKMLKAEKDSIEKTLKGLEE